MGKTPNEFISQTRNFMRGETRLITILLILLLGFNIYDHISTHIKLRQIEKKIDYRYFNLTRSLEDIHNVRINTYDGNLK